MASESGGAGASGASSDVGASSSVRGTAEESGGGGGGSRWPRQQSLALLKIRSDMDAAFRDASLKAPLWEEVSRKMAELGFQRSAKKCREKFENVYKYYKRTKDGRASKPDAKAYRFFDQLEALENNPFTAPPSRPQLPTMAAPPNDSYLQMPGFASSPAPLSVLAPNFAPTSQRALDPLFQPPQQPPPPATITQSLQPTNLHIATSLLSSSTSSSSTSSDEGRQRRRRRKSKWKDYLQRLMRSMVQKQEEMQARFLETLEKRERDRIAREEAWRAREMERMNREHGVLAHERSMAAAKDAAVISFLQKISDQYGFQIPPQEQPQPPPPQLQPPPGHQQSVVPSSSTEPGLLGTRKRDSGDLGPSSSSRWPKAEVLALIKLRTSQDLEHHESGGKGPLWEEISSAMARLGYSRRSKRCKEKWENINKYYKKVKESNKKRPEDSKTCPYFHELEAMYKAKARNALPPLNPEFSARPGSSIPPEPNQQPPQVSLMRNQDDVGLINDDDDIEEVDDEEEDNDDGGADLMIQNQQPATSTAG